MSKRTLFTAFVTLLMMVGMWSAAACETTCAPPPAASAHAHVCCPQQMKSDCSHTGGIVSANAASCSHPHDGGVAAVDSTLLGLQFAPASGIVSVVAMHDHRSTTGALSAVLAAFPRRPSVTPLRI